MCTSLDLSADKLSCHNSLLWSMCASVCHARGISAFLCLITSHVWTFSQCVGVCHAKAFSVPCLIAASLYLVSTGGFVMQCTGKWCLPNMRFSKPRQQLQHATLHYQQCCTEEELPLNAGYSQVQSTKPQSLGYSLNDSPVGLLAWMVEKFRTWSDRRNTNGQLPFSKDFLITNCCLYWLTGNVTSSFRLYYEARHAHEGRQIKQYCKVGFCERIINPNHGSKLEA